MKHLLKYIISGILLLAAFSSCNKPYQQELYLAVDHATIDFPFTPGHSYVQVYSTGDWTVEFSGEQPAWCHLDKNSGSGRGAFRVDVDNNLSGSDRSTVVRVSRGETTLEITVNQKTVI